MIENRTIQKRGLRIVFSEFNMSLGGRRNCDQGISVYYEHINLLT